MGILSWIVFGLLAGVVAKFLMPGDDPGGFIVTILIGIAGAFIGGFLGSFLPFLSSDGAGWNWGSFLTAVVGAIVLLAIYRAVKR